MQQRWVTTALCGVLAGLVPLGAFAQTGDVTGEVTEVVVTAQKKPEPLARAPLSVAVITGDQIRGTGAYDLKDVQILTPSLLITSTANEAQTTARLRGVGTVGDNPGLESSVGVVIDGVVRARTATAMSDLGVLERIEILKGPQTSLFGKGASGGIIQVVTTAPVYEPVQSLELDVGEHGTLGVAGYMSGPLSSRWAGSLSLVHRKRDGEYKVNVDDGPRREREDGDQNYYSVRGQLLYMSEDKVKIRLIGDYTRRDENCCAGTAIAVGRAADYISSLTPSDGVAREPDPSQRAAWLNRSTAQGITDGGLSLEQTVRLSDDVTLVSITAARSYKHTSGYDADFTTADIYYREPDGPFGNAIDTLSQEVRLNGKWSTVDWLIGIYLSSEYLERRDQYLYGKDYEPYMGLLLSGGTNADRISELTGLEVGDSYQAGFGANDHYRQTERNAALYANAEWEIGPSVSLVGGLRLNRQTKSLQASFTNSDNGEACAAAQSLGSGSLGIICLPWSNPAFNNLRTAQKMSDSATTGTLKLVWRPSAALTTYASVGRGWKGGGFNLDREQNSAFDAIADTGFAPETVTAYELGFKGRWMRGRLALDAAIFDQKFENFQLNTFLGTTFLVTSVPQLRSKGLEAEGRLTLRNGLRLLSGFTYTDSRFGSDVVPGLPLVAGGRASFAPKWSVTTQIDYSRPLFGLEFNASLDARYNSAYNTGSDLAPIKLQKAFTLMNGRLTLARFDGSVAVDLWGKNLTDQDYYQVAFGAPFQTGSFNAFMGQPRTLGLSLRLKR
ncbi:MAG: TonB-dependent receptor [Asticcacaulis sp.]